MARRPVAGRMLLAAACLVTCSVRAAEDVAPADRITRDLREAEAQRRATGIEGTWVDRLHDRLYLGVQDLIERTDRRFARHDFTLLPVPATPFRVGLGSELIDRRDGVHVGTRINVDMLLRLPNIESRLDAFITSEDLQESPDRVDRHDDNLRAGLRFTTVGDLDLDVGVRVDTPPVAFTSLRWLRHVKAGRWDLQPFAKLYVESGEGLGVASGITFDRWHDGWLLRASSYLDWSDVRDATAWTQTLMLARPRQIIRFGRYGPIVRGRDLAGGAALQLLVSGEDAWAADTCEVALQFKQATRRRWLYWYVAPLLTWERSQDWKTQLGIRAGFDALFWDLSAR